MKTQAVVADNRRSGETRSRNESLHFTLKGRGFENNAQKNETKEEMKVGKESFEEMPLYTAFFTYMGFYILLFLGYVSQFLFSPKVAKERNRNGYPPLYANFEKFYLYYVFRRIRDSWEKPICSVPGAEITIKNKISHDRGWTFEYSEPCPNYINLGSYNYLGFAQAAGPCADDAVASVEKYGCATASPAVELGTTKLQNELEELTARFLKVEAAIVFGMGFATNSLNINTIISRECLVLSDEKNHASLILGLKLSGAVTRVYKHNDMEDLEKLLKDAIQNGRPSTKEPWNKIFIVTEGIFSMEGSIIKLPRLIELKKKYKAYLYLDEAHSIGALGPTGRGVLDYFNCDSKDVDVLMGTFTKSFGSAGGYIAGCKSLIDHVRANSDAVFYASSMPPPVAQQVFTSMKIIMGEHESEDGIKRIRQLRKNTHYFRQKLREMGCIVYGNDDSPIVPLLVYFYSKVTAVVRAYSSHRIATVGVGFPVTPFLACRIRFCLSAAHTKRQLKYVLDVTEKIADELGLRYSRIPLTRCINANAANDSDSD